MGSSHEAFLLLPSRVDPTLDQQSEEPPRHRPPQVSAEDKWGTWTSTWWNVAALTPFSCQRCVPKKPTKREGLDKI